MSNRTVPAAAEGMLSLTRRQALRALAAGSAAGALAAGVVVVATPTTVTAEPIGAELAILIERHRIAALAQDVAMRMQTQAEEKALRMPCATNEAAFREVDDRFNAACEGQIDAMDAIVAAPIATLADMRAKATYLAQIMPGTCEHNGTIAALLASMGGASTKADARTATIADPMREAVEEYEAAYARQGELANAEDWKGCEAIYEARIGPAESTILNGVRATTFAGAVAAVRYVASDKDWIQDGHAAALRSALTYFDGRA